MWQNDFFLLHVPGAPLKKNNKMITQWYVVQNTKVQIIFIKYLSFIKTKNNILIIYEMCAKYFLVVEMCFMFYQLFSFFLFFRILLYFLV